MTLRIRALIRWFLIALAFLSGEATAAVTERTIGTADKVIGEVYGRTLLKRLTVGEALIANQKVRTGVESAADLKFLDQSHLLIGARSEVVLDRFIYDPDRDFAEGLVNVLKGVLRFASSANALDVTVKTRAAEIGVRGTVFDVFVSAGATEIAVHEGRVQVDSPYGTVSVGAGEVLTISPRAAAGGLPVSTRASGPMRAAVAAMLAMVEPGDGYGDTRRAEAGCAGAAESVAESPERQAALLAAIGSRSLDDLLYMDLRDGRVVIALRPDLAPVHVARIKELVRAEFYDGLAFHSVVPDLVAQTGDPTGTGRGGTGETLAAEFSEESFQRGSVGMRRERSGPDTADSQFFICFADCTQFDGRYTYWGQVIHGMDLIDRLAPGNPPRAPDTIIRLRVAADVTG